jgi:thiol-disulfide isomerase/thioredoxin
MNKITILTWLLFSLILDIKAEDKNLLFPTFKLLKMDSSSYLTNQDIASNKNTIFINFSPTCDHCERTIKSILDNITKFSETQFILTSFESFSSIRKFYFDYSLHTYSSVYIVQESDYSLTKQIQYSSFPCLIIFDKQQKFIKKIDEESNAKTLLKVLNIKSK